MTPNHYSGLQKLLHWTIFLLVAGLYLITFGEDFFERGSAGRDMIWWLHRSFGLLLIALVLWRLTVRLNRGAPSLPADTPKMEIGLAHAMHWLLYLLLLLIPLLGMVVAQLRGDPLSFFGLFTLPQLLGVNRDLGHSLTEIHGILANAILVLAGLHALTALWHHFIRRDGILQRMLPGR